MTESGGSGYFSRSKKFQFFGAIAATMGAFALGTVLGWTSHGTPSLIKENGDWNITKNDESLIGAFLPLGALFSGPPTGYMVGRVGRKTTMLLLSAPFVGGWLILIFAQNLAMVLIARIITGFFGGAFSLAAPVYIGEIAESNVRGLLGSGFQLMVVLGILFTYAIGWKITYVWLSVACAVVPIVFLILMLFVPESPRWYISVGRLEDAGKALAIFRGGAPSDVQEELEDMKASVEESQRNQATFKELFQPFNFRPTLVSLFLMLFQQLSGINAVIFYVTTIFESTGSEIDSNWSTAIVGVVQVIATAVSVLLVDRLGRRLLLIVSDVGMGLSLVALGIFFSISEDDRSSFGWLPLVSLMVFISAFSLGYGPIPWMILGEILPPRAKGLASAIATSFNWTLAFIVAMFFNSLQDAVGINWCYFTFAIVCAVGTFYVFTIVPETKGKSLEEIQDLFGTPKDTSNDGRNNPTFEKEKDEVEKK